MDLTLIDRLSLGAGKIAALMIVPAILVSAYEVLARYVFNAPTNWVFNTAVSFAAISFVLAGPYVLQQRKLIRVTFLYDRLPPAGCRLADLLSSALTVLWGLTLAYAASIQAYEATYRFRGGEWRPETFPGTWDVPIPAALRVIFALACLLFLAQAILEFKRTLSAQRNGRSGHDAH
ncbi:TRAP transporter small permease subunit [Roseibium sp. MMSF_3544]|uniref:TRAP transporter small permease subunit n=1 Tax=unclassified Roseibium TaxID=2629323 RepID=UPI002740245A|nr:TRAP transporter small permease subunit [Roseibium sp. MMSF_3544]